MTTNSQTPDHVLPLDVPLSLSLGEDVNARPKQCYKNAFKALTSGLILDRETVSYVEGFLVDPALPIPVEHGWLEVDGQVADPTLAILREVGSDPETLRYYAGIRLSLGEFVQAVERYGRRGEEEVEYRLPVSQSYLLYDPALYNPMIRARCLAYTARYGQDLARDALDRLREAIERFPDTVELTVTNETNDETEEDVAQ